MTLAVQRRRAIVFALTLGAAAWLAEAARPRRRDAGRAAVPLETIFPADFGDWRAATMAQALVRPADDRGKIYGLYDQVLERTYRNRAGEQVMLCVAYGNEQSPTLLVHRPEICYGASGFRVDGLERAVLALDSRRVNATRLHAWKVGRSEPVTYWTVLGDAVVDDAETFRWEQIAHGLRGEFRDGLLVRISSIGQDTEAAYRLHDAFALDLLRVVAPVQRDRVFGSA